MSFAVVISSFLSGLLGSMGFGGGSVLIVYLTVMLGMPQKQAQGINLIFFLPCAAVSAIYYIRKGMVKPGEILPCAAVGALGTALGFILLRYISGEFSAKLFGCFLAVLGAKELIGAWRK